MVDAIPQSFPAEAWRPIVGYEGWYEVSDHGRVRRVAATPTYRMGRILVQDIGSSGYRRVVLHCSGHTRRRLVHHLVLEAFVGPCPAGQECNHKDGNKANNRMANLEWTTPSANRQHAIKTGLQRVLRGEQHNMAKLTLADVAEIRRLAGTMTQRELAARFGVNQTQISLIQRRKNWRDVP